MSLPTQTAKAEPHAGILTLEHVVATLGAYPLAQTAIIPILMRMTADLNTDTRDLARILSADSALSAKVVHLANSPFYGCVRSITNLTDAIMVLGFYTVRSLAAAASAYMLFRRNEYADLEYELWRHSLAVAITARLIARHIGSRQMEEEIFLVGLLHDTGKLVMLQQFPEVYLPVLEEAKSSDVGHLVLEATRLGFTHADLSAVILEQWGFPARMIGIIQRYAIPDLPFFVRSKKGIEQCDFDMPHVLCFAHECANAMGYDFQEPFAGNLAHLPSARYLGLTADDIERLCDNAIAYLDDELRFFAQLGAGD
jgi:putative nucleotidyltransferase with HDIG domain